MTAIRLRPAMPADLAAVNAVIERAVMTWNLPERVKRLTLPSYRYNAHDLDHLHMVVAEDAGHALLGVAAWEPASPRDLPAGKSGLLLHGLYVDPDRQRGGVGSRLLDAALTAAREQGFDGLLVKAQSDAADFFVARGLQRLPVVDPDRDYPHRFWKATDRNDSKSPQRRR
jgi:predicted N-acetyltransferase YhbS